MRLPLPAIATVEFGRRRRARQLLDTPCLGELLGREGLGVLVRTHLRRRSRHGSAARLKHLVLANVCPLVLVHQARQVDRDQFLPLDHCPHRRGRHERRDLVVRQVLDVAQHPRRTLVRCRRVVDGRHDAEVEEEALVLERQSASKAHLPRHGKRKLCKSVRVVNARHRLSNLHRSAVLVVPQDRQDRAVGSDDTLALAVEDENRESLGSQKLRDGVVTCDRDVAGREEAHALLDERLLVLREHAHEVLKRAPRRVIHDLGAVGQLVVARRVGLRRGQDAHTPEHLDDAIERRADERDLLDLAEERDVELRVAPQVHGCVCLVDPHVDGAREGADAVELPHEVVEVLEALLVCAQDNRRHLSLHDLESECLVGDVRLRGARHPREAVAHDVVICALVACNAGCLVLLLTIHGLVHEVLVIGYDDDVDRVVPGAAVDFLQCLVLRHHLLHLACLAGLCRALKALDLGVAGTHIVVECEEECRLVVRLRDFPLWLTISFF